VVLRCALRGWLRVPGIGPCLRARAPDHAGLRRAGARLRRCRGYPPEHDRCDQLPGRPAGPRHRDAARHARVPANSVPGAPHGAQPSRARHAAATGGSRAAGPRTGRRGRSAAPAPPGDRVPPEIPRAARSRRPAWTRTVDCPPYSYRHPFPVSCSQRRESWPQLRSGRRQQTDYLISSGALTPSSASPAARIVTTPCTRARRAMVICGSFWIMKRKCGVSFPRVQRP